MSDKKESAKQKVAELVEQFNAKPASRRKSMNEAATRNEFILPLFDALGWDTRKTDEVAPEVQVGKSFADYGFRADGITRFFVETKRIAADLERSDFAEQAVSYSYNKGIPWAVLTDFEGLKIFNAEWEVENPNMLRVLDLSYEQFVDEFDKLWLLSKESAKQDALSKEFEARGRKREPVGDRLFALFKEWRQELLQHFVSYRPDHTLGQVDEAVQKILDRLIFIRTLEDRHIEDPMLWPMYTRRKPKPPRYKSTPARFQVVFRASSRCRPVNVCETAS